MRLAPVSCTLAGLFLAACQTVGEPSALVAGTGDPHRDVAAVQAAVDAGGTVTLRGTFNFGEQGRVILRRDVTIVGRDARIEGGFWTFHSPLPEALPLRARAPRIAIRDIHFEGATWAPIHIAHASGLVVAGNRITRVRPHAFALPGLPDALVQQGIVFGTTWAQPDPKARKYLPGVFGGVVAIEDNVIDLTAPEPKRTLGHGIFGGWTTGIDAIVAGNRISNASRNGIEAIDNHRGAEGTGRIRVERNIVAAPAAGISWPTPRGPNGIVLGSFADPAVGTDPARNVTHEVADNDIELSGAASMGIGVLADSAIIRGNRLSASGSESQLVQLAGSYGQITGNVMRGVGRQAIGIVPFRALKAQGNRLDGNDVGGFRASAAQVVFAKGSAGNVCGRQPGLVKVADEGSGNHCP
jgi:hypothetical protein